MEIFTYTVGPFLENTYLVLNESRALLIDPGFSNRTEFSQFRDELEETEASLEAVLLTHAHIDHVLGLGQVLLTWDVPVYLNHTDLFLWNNVESQASRYGLPAAGFSFTPRNLPEQEGLELAGLRMEVLHTPGHAPDHVSLYVPAEGILFAGDALFRESVGRTDLYKGDFDLLAASIREKLYSLPGGTRVLPGHGPETTIAHEKARNPFVRGER